MVRRSLDHAAFRRHAVLTVVSLLVLGCAPLANAGASGTDAAAEYTRPFGPRAPWNIPVAGLPKHPQSATFATRLWHKGASRPGNFNLTFDKYTYPVYYAEDATEFVMVETDRKTELAGQRVPWNPRWQPAFGSDRQVIILDRQRGIEWDFYYVYPFDGTTLRAVRGSRVMGDYRTKEDGNRMSRGIGIQYLAMLVRPEEIQQGEIRHALSMPIRNTDGEYSVPPATKLEHPHRPGGGIPEGMRFALDVSDGEIERWAAALPDQLPRETRRSARIIARALRDYGWFITDTSGNAHLQFEDRLTAEAAWRALGLEEIKIRYKEYPRDLLDGLISEERIVAIVPSDRY